MTAKQLIQVLQQYPDLEVQLDLGDKFLKIDSAAKFGVRTPKILLKSPEVWDEIAELDYQIERLENDLKGSHKTIDELEKELREAGQLEREFNNLQNKYYELQDIRDDLLKDVEKLELERDASRRDAEVERLSGIAVVEMCQRQEAELKRLTAALEDLQNS